MTSRIALLFALSSLAGCGSPSAPDAAEVEVLKQKIVEPEFDQAGKVDLDGGGLTLVATTTERCCAGEPAWQYSPVRALLEPDGTGVPLGWAVFLTEDDHVALNRLSGPQEYGTAEWVSDAPAKRDAESVTLVVPPEALPGGTLRVWAGMQGMTKSLTIQGKDLVTRLPDKVVPYVLVETGREPTMPPAEELPTPAPLPGVDSDPAGSAATPPEGAAPPAGSEDAQGSEVGEPAPQGDPSEAEGQPVDEAGEAPEPPDAGDPAEAEGAPVDEAAPEVPAE